MKKDKNSESITEGLLFIKKSLEKFTEKDSENNKEILEENFKKIDDIIHFFKGIRKILLILLITVVLLFVLLIVTLYFMEKAKNINTEIQDIRTDTIANQILEVKRIMQPDSTYQTSYNYKTRKNKIVTYNQLSEENDSLLENIFIKNKKIKLLEDNIISTNQKIELAEEYYGINFSNSFGLENNKKVEYITIESKKIDSALILLNAYRNKLYYNKELKRWEIK